MNYYDTLIVSPWVEAGSHPRGENIPLLESDFKAEISLSERTVDTYRASEWTLEEIILKTSQVGPPYRVGFVEEARDTFGLRLPIALYEALVERSRMEQTPLSEYILGAHKGDQQNILVQEVEERLERDGIRMWQNVTGQRIEVIPPQPNQYSLRVFLSEKILHDVTNRPEYFCLLAHELPSQDPDQQPAAKADPPQLKKAPEAMSRADIDHYRQWQIGNGVPADFVDFILHAGQGATYGENALTTVAWQRMLTGSSPVWIRPSRHDIAGANLREMLGDYAPRAEFLGAFPDTIRN